MIEQTRITNTSVDKKTSAVHFMRFELTADMCETMQKVKAMKMGCSHARYQHETSNSDAQRKALLGDVVQ